MKTTKQQLRQIIKEELEVILTNEEAGELFGEGVEAQLEEQELNEVDMNQVQIIMDAFAQIGLNLSPAIIMGLMGYAFKQAIDADKEIHKSFNKRPRGFAKPEDQQELNEDDPAMIASMLDPETIEALKLIAQVGMKIGKETLTPVALGLLGVAGARRGMGNRDEDEQMMEQEKVATDVARVGKKLGGVQGLEPLLKSINTRAEFEALMMQFVQLVAKDKLNPNDVKMGIRNVAAAILKGK